MSAKEKQRPMPIDERLKRFPLEIFPARVPSKVTKAKDIAELGMPGAGGAWNPETNTAYLPTGDNAYLRTIRLHESCHAIYTPAGSDKSIAGQAVEDGILHLNHTKTSGRVRRDEVFTALHDLRVVKGMRESETDTAILMTLRALAILKGGVDPKSDVFDYSKAKRELRRALASPVMKSADEKAGGHLQELLHEVLDAISRNDRAAAVSLLTPVMVNAERKQEKGEGWKVVGLAKAHETGTGAAAAKVSMSEVMEKTPSMEDKKKMDSMSASMLSERVKADMTAKGRKWPKMTIRNLHQTLHKKTREGNDSKLASMGIRVRAKKLAIAAVSPTPVKVFERRAHLKGGCVLIDASGSMDFTEHDLLALIEALPMGTIAYYSGNDMAANPIGNLVIYCDKGQMFDALQAEEGCRLPFWEGGNSVDFPAIQWMLSQPGPRWYVGDKGFCGAPTAFCEASNELLEAAKARGMVKHYRDVPSLMASLGIGLK